MAFLSGVNKFVNEAKHKVGGFLNDVKDDIIDVFDGKEAPMRFEVGEGLSEPKALIAKQTVAQNITKAEAEAKQVPATEFAKTGFIRGATLGFGSRTTPYAPQTGKQKAASIAGDIAGTAAAIAAGAPASRTLALKVAPFRRFGIQALSKGGKLQKTAYKALRYGSPDIVYEALRKFDPVTELGGKAENVALASAAATVIPFLGAKSTSDISRAAADAVKRKPGERTGKDILDLFSGKVKFGKLAAEDKNVSIATKAAENVKRLNESLFNQFAFVDDLQTKVLRNAKAEPEPMRMSQLLEQYAGVQGKQQLDYLDFQNSVVKPVKDIYQDFSRYVTMRRVLSRLQSGKANAKVANFTTDEIMRGLKQLKSEIGDVNFSRIEDAAMKFRGIMNNNIDAMYRSGILDEGTAKAIVESADFYAPFRVIKYIDDKVANAGSDSIKIKKSEVDGLLQRMEGITDSAFEVFDPVAVGANQVVRTRALIEKNAMLKRVADLAQYKGSEDFIRVKKKGETIPREMGQFSVYENGKKIDYVVSDKVANALAGLNTVQLSTVQRALSLAAKPFKLGAIGANARFQLTNLLFADVPRNAMMNKYIGLSPVEFATLPLDYARALPAALSLSAGRPNRLMREFLESGAANTTIARTLSPESFVPTTGVQRIRSLSRLPQDVLAKVGDTVEMTSKLAGFQPGKRAVERGATSVEEMVSEVRSFAGSPDFARRGSKTKNLNLLFMFFNARMQGVAADLKRLAPIKMTTTGKVQLDKDAFAALTKLSALGVPTTALMLHNLLPQNRDDYERIPEWERDNYFMIPKSLLYGEEDDRSYFKGDDGMPVRDYWKIQKREIVKLYSNTLEQFIKFAADKDPSKLPSVVQEFIEGIAPVNIDGENVQERFQSIVGSMNPLVKAPAEVAFNANTFTKQDLEPKYIDGVLTSTLPPSQRYKDSTPEAFIWLAQKIKDSTGSEISPIMLEHVANTVTGGAAGNIVPDQKRPSVNERVAQYRGLSKKFNRSPYVSASEAEQDILELAKTATTEDAIKRVNDVRTARRIYDQFMQGEDAEELFADVQPDVLDEFKKIVEKQSIGLDWTDQQIKNLPNNDVKARFIMSGMLQLDQDTLTDFLDQVQRTGILTDDVKKKMKELLAEQQQ